MLSGKNQRTLKSNFPAEPIESSGKTNQETLWRWLLKQRIYKDQQISEPIYDPTNGTISNGDIIYLIDQ